MKKLVCLLMGLMVIIPDSPAQFRFGGEAGFYFVRFSGSNVFDSIAVNGSSGNQGELFFTLFAREPVVKNFELQEKLSVKRAFPAFVVYNTQASCKFCPVQKVQVLGITNISMEVLPQINIPVVGELKANIFLGGNIYFNFSEKGDAVQYGGKHEGVATVMNSLDNAVNPWGMAFVYGGSLEFKNIVAGVRIQSQSRYTRNINVYGSGYDFKNNWKLVMFSLGYMLPKRKKPPDKLFNK